MTIYTNQPQQAQEVEKPCQGIDRLLNARITDLGDFSVRRVLPASHQTMVGPWIFFDHFGPTSFPASKGVDIRPHPHINMATVTYLLEGQMLHQDNTGAVQIIHPGAVNLMFAGKGIVHSERTPQEIRQHTHNLQGLQLWLAMPEEDEERPPHFYHYPHEEIPTFEKDGVTGRVMIGKAFGQNSPVKDFSPTLYFEARLPQGSGLEIPHQVKQIGIYILKGQLNTQNRVIEEGTMAVSNHPQSINVKATEESQIVVIGGDPIGKRYIWWNFVSSDPERINQAALDWQKRKFPEIPTDHDDYIPLPE